MQHCRLSTGACTSTPDELNMQRLEKAVDVLNEAHTTAVGISSHINWPVLFGADPENTDIECFRSGETNTTSVLGVLNAIISFKDSFGLCHRVSFSVEHNRYVAQTHSME